MNGRQRISSLLLNIAKKAFNSGAVLQRFSVFRAGQSIVQAAATEVRQGQIVEQIGAVWSQRAGGCKIDSGFLKQIGATQNFSKVQPNFHSLLRWQRLSTQAFKSNGWINVTLHIVLKPGDACRDV